MVDILDKNKVYGVHALRIAVVITMLVFLLLAGSASSISDSSTGTGMLQSNATIYSTDRTLADFQAPVFSPEMARPDGWKDIPIENDLLGTFHMSGMLEANGTHFEIRNSSYLNITLDSSETIHLNLESAPEMVTMRIESAYGADSAQITIGGFAPLTTYHKYEDDYHNHTAFTTDANGSYTYTQDLSRKHLIFIQPRPSTRFINDNVSGGECTLIGTWNVVTKTCTLTTDLTETVQIDSNGVTLDGNGHTITGSNTGNGVYLWSRSGVTIKNLNVKNFYTGIYLSSSTNNTLNGNNAMNNNYRGIYLIYSSNNTLSQNKASNNFDSGISLYSSSNNTLNGNNANSNPGIGISLYSTSNNNTLSENNATNNNYGIYLVSSSNNTLVGNNAANNIINGYFGGTGISLSSSSNSTLSGNDVSNNNNLGISLYSSNNNTLSGNDVSNNNYGIYLVSSSNNTLSGNDASNNGNEFSSYGYGISLYGSNNTLSGNMMTGNKYNFKLYGNNDSDFDNQIDTSNLVDGRPIYYVIKASDTTYDSSSNAGTFYCISCINVTIKNLNLNKNSIGVYLWNSSQSRIENVSASNNDDDGIFLSSSNNNTMIDNNASNNGNDFSSHGYGLLLESSSNNILRGNNVNSNIHGGIFLLDSSNNTVTDNNANSNWFWLPVSYGISLSSSNNNTLSGNNAENNNGNGISLSSSRNNTLSENNASNNNVGISLSSSSNNTLSENNASNNNEGIYLESSSNNLIYNNFFNNYENVYFYDLNINTWNTTRQSSINIVGGPYIGGNFWTNPSDAGFSQTCLDDDKDGICDSNYMLDSGNVDYLPLAEIPSGFGYISGRILNNSIVIDNAIVSTNTSNITNTDASGSYSLLVPAGTYKLKATGEPGFYPNSSITATVVSGTSLMQDIELIKKPIGNITGNVKKLTGTITGNVSST